MKAIVITLLMAFAVHHACTAQLVPCAPKRCMIVYQYHDDTNPLDTVKAAIQNFLPDILIDNTPGGLYGQINGGVGCIPSNYTALGTEVFCYITGGYEGTKYLDYRDDLSLNLARVMAIDSDGATGVFLDEVSSFPDTVRKAYITAIWNQCQVLGLKLILNPGVDTFDSWLMGHCDYILTDETYDGTRVPTASEIPYLSRVLVVTQGVTNAADAAIVSLDARDHGFGYSYACDSYIHVPNYLAAYRTAITQPPATPTILLFGATLQSSAPYGNQWYSTATGIIAGATGQSYTPSVNGTYYSIVTLQGCSSDTSNLISILSTGLPDVGFNAGFSVFPNPSTGIVTISMAGIKDGNATLEVFNGIGALVRTFSISQHVTVIDMQNVSNGLYHFVIKTESGTVRQSHVISR